MNFFLAPVYSLFSLKFYRSLAAAPMSRGILYLLYFSVITAIAGVIACMVLVLPKVDKEADYFIKQIPAVTFTADGAKTALPQPYNIKTREGAVLVAVDTAKETIEEKEMGNLYAFVTSKKAYVRQGEREVRIYDLAAQAQGGQSFMIDSAKADRVYQVMRMWTPLFLLLIIFAVAFVWKLSGALVYSLMGMVLNLPRKERLCYSGIFNITVAAMVLVWILQIIAWFTPYLSLSYNLIVSLLVTVLYQTVFIFATRSQAKAESCSCSLGGQ